MTTAEAQKQPQKQQRWKSWMAGLFLCFVILIGLARVAGEAFVSYLAARNSWRTNKSVVYAVLAAAAPLPYFVYSQSKRRRS